MIVSVKRQAVDRTMRRESMWTGYSHAWLQHWRQTKNYKSWQKRVRCPPKAQRTRLAKAAVSGKAARTEARWCGCPWTATAHLCLDISKRTDKPLTHRCQAGLFGTVRAINGAALTEHRA